MEDTIGKKAVKGTVWSALDKFGVMVMQFAVNIVLSRLLTPSDFGAVGMLYVFMALSLTLIDGGFGSALIQKKVPSETDYSTIFFWNLGVGILLYIILFFSAPYIADFYKMPILSGVLRAIGLSLIFSSITNIQNTRLRKKLQFKDLAISNIGTYLSAALVSIYLAYKGYGVWSLVAMNLMQGFSRIIWLFLITHWIPLFKFSITSFKNLFSFGGYLFISYILEAVGNNIQGLVIGRRFSAAQMGYYSQASKLDNITSYAIPQTLATVIYPVMSQYQDDMIKMNSLMDTYLRVVSFVIWPILSLLIIIANPLIKFLYGNQWDISIPYYQILCCGGFFMSLNNIPYYAVAACGKSKALLKMSFYKWGCLFLFILIGMNFGMDGIVWSLSASIANIFIANLWLAKKYTGFGFINCLSALYASAIASILSMVCVYSIQSLSNLNWIILTIIFAGLYFLSSLLINRKGITLTICLLNKLKKND